MAFQPSDDELRSAYTRLDTHLRKEGQLPITMQFADSHEGGMALAGGDSSDSEKLSLGWRFSNDEAGFAALEVVQTRVKELFGLALEPFELSENHSILMLSEADLKQIAYAFHASELAQQLAEEALPDYFRHYIAPHSLEFSALGAFDKGGPRLDIACASSSLGLMLRLVEKEFGSGLIDKGYSDPKASNELLSGYSHVNTERFERIKQAIDTAGAPLPEGAYTEQDKRHPSEVRFIALSDASGRKRIGAFIENKRVYIPKAHFEMTRTEPGIARMLDTLLGKGVRLLESSNARNVPEEDFELARADFPYPAEGYVRLDFYDVKGVSSKLDGEPLAQEIAAQVQRMHQDGIEMLEGYRPEPKQRGKRVGAPGTPVEVKRIAKAFQFIGTDGEDYFLIPKAYIEVDSQKSGEANRAQFLMDITHNQDEKFSFSIVGEAHSTLAGQMRFVGEQGPEALAGICLSSGRENKEWVVVGAPKKVGLSDADLQKREAAMGMLEITIEMRTERAQTRSYSRR